MSARDRSTFGISPSRARLARLAARDADVRAGEAVPARRHGGVESTPTERDAVKGSQKPKKLGKKPAQKKLKERRVEKRAAARRSRSLDV